MIARQTKSADLRGGRDVGGSEGIHISWKSCNNSGPSLPAI